MMLEEETQEDAPTKKRQHKRNLDPKQLQRNEQREQRREEEIRQLKQSNQISTLECFGAGTKSKQTMNQAGREF